MAGARINRITSRREACEILRDRAESGSSAVQRRALKSALEYRCDWLHGGPVRPPVVPVVQCPPPAPCPPQVPCTPPGCPPQRDRTTVITPQGKDAALYRVIEATSLVASHDPMTFSPDPRYPAGVQEREYQFDQNEQGKVARGAQALDPTVLLHRSPTAVDGPPLVTEDGCALGGNGRSMMLKRAYQEHPDRAARYREALACAAGDFGLEPAVVKRLREPVLVRVVEGTRCDSTPGELAKAVRRYNEGLTQAIDTRALGVSQARQLSGTTVQLFGQLVSGDRTLREVMREDPRPIVRVLEQDGVITAQNRTRWVLPSGELTNEAKDQIEAMFVGRVLGSSERIRATPAAVLGKVEKAVPYLTAVAGRNQAFDLTRATQEAVDLLNRAQNAGTSLEMEIQQRGLFGGAPSREGTEIARMLTALTPTQVRGRFQEWARKADFDPAQGLIGERPPTWEEAFRALTTAPKLGRAMGRGMVVKHGGGMARVVGVFGAEGRQSEGLGPGEVRVEYMTGPSRGRIERALAADLGDVVG